MRFAYRVRDEQGRLKSGIWEAEHKQSVVEGLLLQDYYIVFLQELPSQQQGIHMEIDLAGLSRVDGRDLVIFTRQLSVMLTAGLPVVRCLEIAAQQTSNSRLKHAALIIQEDMEAGTPLWKAFGRHSKIFSGLYVSMLRAGETGGVLDLVLDKLSFHLEKEREFYSQLKSASVYPLFISSFAALVVFLIVTLIVPRFVSIFQSSGVELPMPTRFLIKMGTILQTRGLLIIFGLLACLYLLRCIKRTSRGGLVCDTLILHLPLLGRSISQIAAARFARTVGVLIKSGIDVLQALEVVKDMIGNAVISRAVSTACDSIREGESITSPLQRAGVFEPIVTQMIAVGEETGRLDEMLIHLSDYYEAELIRTLDTLLKLIEPVLIFSVALLVGGIVIAILYPMFEMIDLIGV